MQDDTVINIENLSKHFILPHQRSNTLKSFFVNPFNRFTNEKQLAFHRVSFQVKKGEFFGIVGRNGSGKSTLLKCIAGVYSPDSGTIEVSGTLVPFIELGVGFNPELSGRDNVYLNGSLLGFSRTQMSEMYDDIVAFAELEKFMDQKLKNYSSGMQVRLAFSIAIRARGDILLLDEVLAVGDSAFQQKCFDYFASVKNEKKTIILVSHSMSTIERFCDRALFLEDGEVKHIGTSSEVARMYEEMFLDEEVERRTRTRKEQTELESDLYKDETVAIKKVRTKQSGKFTKKIQAKKPFTLDIEFESKASVPKGDIRVVIKNKHGFSVIAADTESKLGLISFKKGVAQRASFTFENNITNGIYSVMISFVDRSQPADIGLTQKRIFHEFTVSGIIKYADSLTHPEVAVEIMDD